MEMLILSILQSHMIFRKQNQINYKLFKSPSQQDKLDFFHFWIEALMRDLSSIKDQKHQVALREIKNIKKKTL